MEILITPTQVITEITPSVPFDTIIDVQGTPSVTIDVPENVSITDVATSTYDIIISDVAIQGLPGAQGPVGPVGPPLTFDALTEQQKIELRGDVGSTSTNLVNMFYDSLLS